MKQLLFIIILGVDLIALANDSQSSNVIIHSGPSIDVEQKVATYEAALKAGYFLLTTNEEAQIKCKLDEYEKGKIELTNLNEGAGKEGVRQLIGYYLLHSNDISAKTALVFSRTYAGCGVYSESAILAAKYVNVYSNDSFGWRLLGNANLLLRLPERAIYAYTNAVRLGDNPSLEPLASSALEAHRPDIIQPYIPRMMALKKSVKVPREDRYNFIGALLSYSLIVGQKDIFVETLKGESLKDLLNDGDIKVDVESGCKIFRGKDIDKIRQVLTDAESQNSNTNSYTR